MAAAPGPPETPGAPGAPGGPGRRVLLVSSSGGVLLDLMAMEPWWARHRASWVAVEAPDTRDLLAGREVVWAPELKPHQPLDVLRATRRARRLLMREGVELVVSAGSGVAVPYFVAARLAGIPAWWVETLNVLQRPGLAARLCARLSALVVVQHPHLLADHPRAVNVGELF